MIDPSPILALAPMAGITDWPMRLLCAEQGCNYTTTEMVSAMGYLTAPDSLYVYQYLLAVHPDEPRPAVQLFGHHPDLMGQAAQRLSELGRFSAIDINMGCPARKVTGPCARRLSPPCENPPSCLSQSKCAWAGTMITCARPSLRISPRSAEPICSPSTAARASSNMPVRPIGRLSRA